MPRPRPSNDSARIFRAAASLIAVSLLASCAATPANTYRDQLRSIAKYDTFGIDAPVTLPELSNRSDTGFSAPDFLTLHSGLIVSGEYVDEDFKQRIATSRGTQEGILELGFSVPIAQGGSGFGSCAPVSSDGYFLTAAHVLSHEGNYVLYATSDRSKTYIDYAPLRVVYRNDEADFAIVHAPLKTPRYLNFRREPIPVGTTVFAGGWMHEKGGGVFLESQPVSSHPGYQKLVTSLPMIKGDSGSPMIDQQGRLCGILSTMRLGVVVKMKPKATSVMLAPEKVEAIIRKDRS